MVLTNNCFSWLEGALQNVIQSLEGKHGGINRKGANVDPATWLHNARGSNIDQAVWLAIAEYNICARIRS